MGKAKKKDKKGKGAEKTAAKTDRKMEKKMKKQLKDDGEEDIETLIAQFKQRDLERTNVIEEKVPPPSARCNMTLTPHPDKDELILFGGEYCNGNKTFLYNDLFTLNTRTNEWSLVKVPNPPPPRCAHQAVAVRQGGGQLWIFGGEFASPSQNQFYHYKDLWVYHLKEKRWEEVKAQGAPSARSGHRMVLFKKLLIVFGGFRDNIRDFKYYNDVHIFNLETYTWSKLEVSGTAPSPRSGCQLAALNDPPQVVLYGGYSKEKIKKDVDRGVTHTDMFILKPEDKAKAKEGEVAQVKWKWVNAKQSAFRPLPRSGFSLTVTSGNKAVMFGGVYDEDEDDEDVSGVFYNDMYSLELDKAKWFPLELRGKKETAEKKRRRRKEKGATEEEEEGEEGSEAADDEMMETEEEINKLKLEEEVKEDDIFTVKIGPQTGALSSSSTGQQGDAVMDVDNFMPRPRMNALLAVKNGVLFLYGGFFEVGDRQVTLSDLYSLDLHKLDQWQTIIEDTSKTQEWLESDSSSGEEEDEMDVDGAVGGAGGDDDDEDDDEEDDEPEVEEGESLEDYFSRTKSFWKDEAIEKLKSEGQDASGKKLKKCAMELAEECYKDQTE